MKRLIQWSFYIRLALAATLMATAVIVLPGCGEDDTTLTVYSGRTQSLVHPLLESFAEDTGTPIEVRYGSSSGMAATIQEEGDNTPADVVFLQDPGSLGALSQDGFLKRLPDELLDKVDRRFRSPQGEWVGTSGRVRTIVYNTSTIDPETDLPDSIMDFVDPEWRGRVGWAPPNASFQAFVTGLRVHRGDAVARQWLEDMRDNDAQPYRSNLTTIQAVARGEVDVGFVNHYYMHRFLEEEGPGFGARNHFLGDGDPGALVLVAGAAILEQTNNSKAAERFIEYLLSEEAQRYFAEETTEYPLAAGVEPVGDLPPLSSLDPPDVDLGSLSDLRGTLALLRDVGILP